MASTVLVTPSSERAPGAPSGLSVTDLLLLCMAFIWGRNFIVVKFATGVFAPQAFTSGRIFLAVVALWPLVTGLRSTMPSWPAAAPLSPPRLPAPVPSPIKRLLILDKAGDGSNEIPRTAGTAALETVMSQPYRGHFLKTMGRSAQHFGQAAKLLKHTEVYSAPRRWGYDVFAEEAENEEFANGHAGLESQILARSSLSDSE